MNASAQERKLARFGLFGADTQQRVLTKNGLRVRLQDQPFQVLALLLERPGEIVTREELREKLWSSDTYVEFDAGLNTAIKKLRLALGDSADNPRFIETVHRRGYRFVAPVSLTLDPQISATQGVPSEDPPSLPRSSSGVNPTLKATDRRPAWRLRYLGPLTGALLLAVAIGAYLLLRAPDFHVTPSDTVVVADFANSTGETVFDDALREATEVGLQQSPFLNILSDRKMAAILKQMGRTADDRVTSQIAIELCQRAGSKVTVQGSISSIGTAYLIGLTAIRCDNGAPIALEQGQAGRKEDVVDALGKATTRLRARLGESMPSVQIYDVPLEQATTPSLDALKAFSQAFSTQAAAGDVAAVPFFKRAIVLDPNFALAYGALAATYRNLGEAELARQNAIEAFDLKDRVTDFEKLSLEAWYYLYVTGDLEKAAEAFEIERRTFPVSSRSLNDLGVIYGSLGRFDKEIEIDRNSLRNGAFAAATYGNLAVSLMALGQMDAAGNVLSEADKRQLQSDYLLQVNYWNAFLRGDAGQMQRIVSQANDVPGAQSVLLSEQANTEAYSGHFEKACELYQAAAKLMQNERQDEAAGLSLARAAVLEAESGDSVRARDLIARALHLTQDQHVLTLSALVMIRCGDSAKGRLLAEKLSKEYPANTFVQKYWTPVLKAMAALRQDNGREALSLLSGVEPLDSAAPDEFSSSTLYPVYIRGQAYLKVGDGSKAAAEFQKMLDHPGVVVNFPLAALARLGRARAYTQSAKSAEAVGAYRDFLQLWKGADPDIPIMKQAETEYSQLQ